MGEACFFGPTVGRFFRKNRGMIGVCSVLQLEKGRIMAKNHESEMKNGDKSDEALSVLLKRWEIHSPIPNDFKRDVWNRIASRQPMGFRAVLEPLINWFTSVVNRRSVVLGYLCVTCLIGVSVGLIQVKDASREYQEEMAHRYITSVNPYLHAER